MSSASSPHHGSLLHMETLANVLVVQALQEQYGHS